MTPRRSFPPSLLRASDLSDRKEAFVSLIPPRYRYYPWRIDPYQLELATIRLANRSIADE